jgi:hypothetical protein
MNHDEYQYLIYLLANKPPYVTIKALYDKDGSIHVEESYDLRHLDCPFVMVDCPVTYISPKP